MEVYYNCGGGGCFHGSCLVSMEDGSSKRVDTLTKGEKLLGSSMILSVIKIKC